MINARYLTAQSITWTFYEDCANYNRDSKDCNCKHILIAEDGSSKTFIPFGEKHGEFPL